MSRQKGSSPAIGAVMQIGFDPKAGATPPKARTRASALVKAPAK